MTALLEVIFPYIVLFYVLDCFVHVKRFHLGFASHLGGRFRLKAQGLRFIGLSPVAQLFHGLHFPLFRAGQGVYLWRKGEIGPLDLYEPRNFVFVEHASLAGVKRQHEKLIISDSLALPLGDEALVGHVADWLKEMARLGPESREQAPLVFTGPASAAEQALTAHAPLLNLVRLSGLALFVAVFLLLPAALYLQVDLRLGVVGVLILFLYLLALGTALAAQWRIDRGRGRLAKLLLILLCSPVDAMHALHMLTRNLALGADWLELAARLLPSDRFREVLRREMKRLLLSRERCDNPELLAWLTAMEARYQPLLPAAGLTTDAILAPPERSDAAAGCYCPNCENEFLPTIATCPDCNLTLRTFTEEP